MLTKNNLPKPILVSRLLAGRAFLVKTPACIAYFAYLKRWLLTGNSGGVVFGRPRLGKTSATRWVLRAIQEIFGRVPFIEIPIRKQHLAHEGAFFQHLCRCGRHRHYGQGTVADRRDRFIEMLIGKARRSPTRTVILFLDEAQQLAPLHYEWLLNVANEMDVAGYRLFCLLVGQSELSKRRNELICDEREELVGRFMTEAWQFSGLGSVEDLRTVLEGYDVAVYPANDRYAPHFLSYFVPMAFQSGWRLASLAGGFWQAFESVWNELKAKGDLALPMHYVNSSVALILDSVSTMDSSTLVVKQEQIANAVKLSGFVASTNILRGWSSEPRKGKK